MSNLYIQEIFVQVEGEKRYCNCETEVYETCYNSIGKLFKACQQDYGRCISKQYIGERQQIGWVFEKRVKFEDCGDTYLQEVWVSVHDKTPETTVKYFYSKEGFNNDQR